MKPQIKVYSRDSTLFRETARYIAHVILQTLSEHKVCTFALSGGSTPAGLYRIMATEPYRTSIPWNRVHVFWGDERCVPPDHQESNYRLARETLLDHVAIPEENIHRVPAEKSPELAAQEYESKIKEIVPREGKLPRFDIMLLGMGDDGHTASIFPETSALSEMERYVVPVYVHKLSSYRITLTFPVINNSRSIILLVKGSSKASIVRRVLGGEGGDDLFPVQRVMPKSGELIWFMDREAARLL